MAQAAQTPSSPQETPFDEQEFVQLKDGTLAWLNPANGEITPAQRQPEWGKLFALLEKWGPAPPEFMRGIEDPPLENEDIF